MRLLLFALVFLSASPLNMSGPPRAFFVVWNVGQGQWTTWVGGDQCRHFDLGGEHFPWQKAKALCGDKKNFVYLSHWDWDHIGGLREAKRFFPSLCLARAPLGSSSPRKERLLPPTCLEKADPDWEWIPSLRKKAGSNDLSQVFLQMGVLLPGDSPLGQEKHWAPSLPAEKVRILALGHHGSRSSTGEDLLDRLPGLRQAVSSARWVRYHHPHPLVQARLRSHRIPLLKTEDWGSIWFGL